MLPLFQLALIEMTVDELRQELCGYDDVLMI